MHGLVLTLYQGCIEQPKAARERLSVKNYRFKILCRGSLLSLVVRCALANIRHGFKTGRLSFHPIPCGSRDRLKWVNVRMRPCHDCWTLCLMVKFYNQWHKLQLHWLAAKAALKVTWLIRVVPQGIWWSNSLPFKTGISADPTNSEISFCPFSSTVVESSVQSPTPAEPPGTPAASPGENVISFY